MKMKERKMILFTDIGDTIIDESTEIRNSEDVVQRAECIPGARETCLRLHEKGYRIAMVAAQGLLVMAVGYLQKSARIAVPTKTSQDAPALVCLLQRFDNLTA